MSNEEINNEVNELELLKERADLMGITYHPSIGVAKLKEKIENKQNQVVEPKEQDDYAAVMKQLEEEQKPVIETPAMIRDRVMKKATKLVRVRVTNMNPIKGNLNGAIISAGNSQIGFIKKYIPFNTEQGWHVPQIILTALQNTKYMAHYEVKIGNKKIKKHKLVPEYAIEILPPLTAAELKDLAQRQVLNQGSDE